ncbi:MAG: hypothetical protein SVR04_01900 [Spirochaetota bacterium]|nr:hypothetical protein [Spirochaetota bacterium]
MISFCQKTAAEDDTLIGQCRPHADASGLRVAAYHDDCGARFQTGGFGSLSGDLSYPFAGLTDPRGKQFFFDPAGLGDAGILAASAQIEHDTDRQRAVL